MWTKLVCFIFFFLIDSGLSFDTDLGYVWQKYKEKFHKRYSSDMEEAMRKSHFEENLKLIARHNRHHDLKLTTFTLGLNEFSDMSLLEFRSAMESSNMQNITGRSTNEDYSMTVRDANSLPRMVDWRERYAVSPVKNQGNCGSSWAFATTGAIESAYAIKDHKLVLLSEQQLLDCITAKWNSGCRGGRYDMAFQYVIENKGISKAESYPYISRKDTCKFDEKNIGATISSVKYIRPGSEKALQQAVAIGPVAVAINGLNDKFKNYKNGIFDDATSCSGLVNIAVLVVSYGDKDNNDYWIVKNSWGKKWGMGGYGLMARNKNNQCGIASYGFFPVI